MTRSIRLLGWRGLGMSMVLMLAGPMVAWAQTNTFPASGNVGIGTLTPMQKLHVVAPTGSLQATFQSTDLTSFQGIFLGDGLGGTHASATIEVINENSALVSRRLNLEIYNQSYTGSITFHTNYNARVAIDSSGNVGIGTGSPAAKLHVAGDAQVDGNLAAKYQDVAEWVQAPSLPASGVVVVVDPQSSNQVLPASTPYDTRVAGVVSARPGLLLGEAGDSKVKVAHSGRVKVKVDAGYGPIVVGDLLVTSPTPGHAMRSIPLDFGGTSIHRPGTLLGKALEPLQAGQGEILVLLILQ